ncbi:SDR family NAD(P)-dependent oxidoreductase [Streptomyces sp. NPDC026672]|uniref:SDR family NAD(P)-dependent oxidoreductase n=1 Tax=unclassified Streptomyces TaxID=2593676 RepID=UPI0033CDD860
MLLSSMEGGQRGVLAEKSCIVTGGCRGLGLEISRELVKAGARLVVTGRDQTALDSAVRDLSRTGAQVMGVRCDVRDERAVTELAARVDSEWGSIDVLVNNSGIAGPTAPLWESTVAEWRETLDVNLLGTYLCCRAVLPFMIEKKSGSVITIGSMTGKRPLFGRTSYAASKTALIGFTRNLALDAGPFGVRANLVSPGPLEGDRIQQVFEAQASSRGVAVETAREEMLSQSPLRRLVPQVDVARAVTFLASDAAASITGEDLNVSAGIVMH